MCRGERVRQASGGAPWGKQLTLAKHSNTSESETSTPRAIKWKAWRTSLWAIWWCTYTAVHKEQKEKKKKKDQWMLMRSEKMGRCCQDSWVRISSTAYNLSLIPQSSWERERERERKKEREKKKKERARGYKKLSDVMTWVIFTLT